jgi:hypothetical protein
MRTLFVYLKSMSLTTHLRKTPTIGGVYYLRTTVTTYLRSALDIWKDCACLASSWKEWKMVLSVRRIGQRAIMRTQGATQKAACDFAHTKKRIQWQSAIMRTRGMAVMTSLLLRCPGDPQHLAGLLNLLYIKLLYYWKLLWHHQVDANGPLRLRSRHMDLC